MKKYRKNPICIGCGIQLKNHYALRCRSCNGLYNNNMEGKIGKDNPNWKGGNKVKCIDCNKIINLGYKRCHSCACKYLWTKKEYRNKNLGNGINNSMYGKKHTDITKSKMSIRAGGNGVPGDYGEYGFRFTEELKGKIRKRDNYICQNCSITEEEHIIVFGFKLSIHHIDYNKQNCEEDNLLTLCNSCNTRANYNRSYWREKYGRVVFQGS